jgi:hypothetical protein
MTILDLLKMAKQKINKQAYEEYLNELGYALTKDNFIMGGKQRNRLYGAMLRKYDSIAFSVGYNEWKREIQGHL